MKKNKEHIDAFCEMANGVGIPRDDITFEYSHPVGLTANHKGILGKISPSLKKDKDGLYSIADIESAFNLHPMASGNYSSTLFTVLFSSYFRRGHHKVNNWTPNFVRIFSKHFRDKDKLCYVLLDEDRVRVDKEQSGYFEMDTWYGPKFNRNIEDIADGNTKLIAPADLPDEYIEIIFGGITSLNAAWTTSEWVKTFQAMEFKLSNITLDVDGTTYHPSRYVHSEYDKKSKRLIHLDGAVQLLSTDEYLQRSASDFGNYNKSSRQIKPKYRKLFKINGPISIDDWIELVSHYFHANSLIHEYFSGKLPDRITDSIDKIRESANESMHRSGLRPPGDL